jgi:uncharacterized repeat protein (TIGR03803 family)
MTHLRRALATVGTLLLALLTITSYADAQTLTTLHSFTAGDDGIDPLGVVVGAGGVLYGDTQSAGAAYKGTAFSLTPPTSPGAPWTESVYSFPGGKAGSASAGNLAVANGGAELFGTSTDSATMGTVYVLHPPTSPGGDWAQRVLHEFTGSPSDGQSPNSVVVGSGGVIYGTTLSGGASTCNSFGPGCGTVFSLTPPASPGGAWTEAVLYNFGGYPSDGSYPTANVAIGGGGVLYGTTKIGGENNSGTVFSLTPPSSAGGAWTETVLYSFPSEIYGCQPGQLMAGSRGVLYGVTLACGTSNASTVFSLTPPASPGGKWKQTVLHSFAGGSSDGFGPKSLVEYGGVLYGATGGGGPANDGTLFSLTPPASEGGSWTETVLYFFSGGSDGATPTGVAMGPGGVLYGATVGGGISNWGTVFSFTP